VKYTKKGFDDPSSVGNRPDPLQRSREPTVQACHGPRSYTDGGDCLVRPDPDKTQAAEPAFDKACCLAGFVKGMCANAIAAACITSRAGASMFIA